MSRDWRRIRLSQVFHQGCQLADTVSGEVGQKPPQLGLPDPTGLSAGRGARTGRQVWISCFILAADVNAEVVQTTRAARPGW